MFCFTIHDDQIGIVMDFFFFRRTFGQWLFLACLLLFVCPCALAASSGLAATSFPTGQAQGRYVVGFREVEQYDPSRSYRTNGLDLVTGSTLPLLPGRPVQMLVWYPAQEGGEVMNYGDYLTFGGREDRFDRTPAEVARVARDGLRWLAAAGLDQRALEAIKRQPVNARRDAPAQAGHFPVVIYAASGSASPFENDVLCEYLASHGYVVVAIPSVGSRRRYMGDGNYEASHGDLHDTLDDTEAQALDIGYAIGYASALPDADEAHVAVVAFSWGGMASVFAAARDDRIKALVQLDGAMRYYPGVLRMAPYVRPERLRLPMLFFASNDSPIQPARDSQPGSLVDRMRYGDVTTVQMYPLSHNDFAADTQRFDPTTTGSHYTVGQVHAAYGWMARYTLAFLDAYMKDDARGRAFLRAVPAANGVSPGLMASAWRAGVAGPLGLPDFVTMLAADGWVDPVATYERFRRKSPRFVILEDALDDWQAVLAEQGENEKARGIARLHVHMFPRESGAYDALGMADEALGDTAGAGRDYEHALAADRFDSHAAKRLAALRSAGVIRREP